MKRLSRHALILLHVLISTGFMVLILRRTDLSVLGAKLAAANAPLLTLSLGTKLAGLCLMALRLDRLARRAGSGGFGRAFRAQSIAFVGNNVLPFRIGEALKVGHLARSGTAPAFACLGIAAVERLLDSVFLVLFIVAALVLFPDLLPRTSALPVFSGIALTGFAALYAIARLPAPFERLVRRLAGAFGERAGELVGRFAGQFATGIAGLASPRLFLSTVSITAGYWISSALSVYIWLAACHIDVPWHASIVVLVMVSLATVIPSAPGFIGTYHYFAVLALGLFDVGLEAATSFAIVGHALAIVPFTLLLSPFVAHDILSLLHLRGPRPSVAGARPSLGDGEPGASGAPAAAQMPLF